MPEMYIIWHTQHDDRVCPICKAIDNYKFGPFTDVLPVFSEMMLRWLPFAGLDINRLAFGAILRIPARSRDEAYSVMSHYLPFPLSRGSSDFLYRINRPRPSKALGDGTLINRLATWAAMKVETVVVSVPIGSGGTEAVSREGEPFFACRLELDINTAGDRSGALPQDRFDRLLAELAEAAAEIATQGDQP